MDVRTAAIAVDAARIRKGHALKLRVVQHKYAAQIAAHARAVERHARKLLRMHGKINTESDSTAISGPDFADHHTIGFDEYESIAAQQPTIRASVLWKALESSMSSKWPTL
jgi:hypothetical protein